MTGVLFWIRALGVLVLLIGLTTPPVAAQDIDAMAKWTAYTVVHYKVVGEHSGQVPVLAAQGLSRQAQVTDRVEFELDWNQQEFKLVGTPVVRNSPSKLGAITPMSDCPAPRIEGTFELMTLQAIKGDGPLSMSGIVTLETRRDYPAGAIPTKNEFGCKEWIAVKVKSEAVPVNFQLPPAMSLAMPGGAPYKLSPNGKSLIFNTDGWVWTCTPTGVKWFRLGYPEKPKGTDTVCVACATSTQIGLIEIRYLPLRGDEVAHDVSWTLVGGRRGKCEMLKHG